MENKIKYEIEDKNLEPGTYEMLIKDYKHLRKKNKGKIIFQTKTIWKK